MNLLNLPMMDSAVFKKMNAGKQAKTPDAATQAHDSKKRPLVPVAVRDELLTMGISAKKMRSEDAPQSQVHLDVRCSDDGGNKSGNADAEMSEEVEVSVSSSSAVASGQSACRSATGAGRRKMRQTLVFLCKLVL